MAQAVPRGFLLVAIAAGILLGLAPVVTAPAVVPSSAAPTEFSGERALDYLRVIAAEPHPMGSPQHEAVIAYLVAELRALGLEPHVQTTSSTGAPETVAEGVTSGARIKAGRVSNVIARLPGTADTGALLLIGNYDSMPTTPGAGDPNVSAAVVLETVRALRSGPALRNDVIVAFMDVDPDGLIGDQAFVAEHPWAGDVRFALAFVTAGIAGPALLETVMPAADRFVADALRVAPHPVAYSALTDIMQALGGGPMLWVARASGGAGFEFIALAGHQTYHTQLNNVQRLDPRLLQHHGSYALSLTRYFGGTPLDEVNGPRLVFFNVAPERIISYPAGWAAPLAGLVGLLGLAVVVFGVWRGRLTWRGLLGGAGVFPLALVGIVAVTTLLWVALTRLNPNHQVFLIGIAYGSEVYLIGLIGLMVALTAGVYTTLGRWVRPLNLAVGALLTPIVLLALTSFALPGASYLFAWPLLAVLLALGWRFLAPRLAERPGWQAVALALGAAPAVVLLTPLIPVLFAALTQTELFVGLPLAGGVFVLVALALGLLLLPLQFLAGSSRWILPGLAAAAGVLVIGYGIATSGFDADRPRPNSIAYVLDADTGRASWVSADGQLDDWTRQFFAADAAPGGFVPFPNSMPDWVRPGWQAPAPPVALAAPELVVLEDAREGEQRIMLLRASSARGAPNLYVDIQAASDIAVTLDGKPVDLSTVAVDQRSRVRVAYHALPPEGIELGLTIADTGPISVRLEDRSNGLPSIPGVAVAPRPADMMPAPFELADPTVVSRAFVLAP